ncbi:MAG: PASTA domain-containing protein [Crocinitomicaceae bacterium]|nr:PASTA domain-containing protein [Crocinitomicaceae bacterium]
MGLPQKLKNFIFTKKFIVNVGLIIIAYICVFFIVNIYLSSYTNHGEKIEVPNLVGNNEKEVKAILDKIGLNYEVSETVYDPSKPEGSVLSQDPLPSANSKIFIKEGRVIKIKISKKSQLIEMPNCIDKSQRFAESVLKNSGLKYIISYTPSVESAGAVVEQLYKGKSVHAKDKIPIGSTITLIVGKKSSDETQMIPDLMGLTICDVKNRLSTDINVSLVVICDGCVTSADTCSAKVYSQSPEYIEGATFSSGSTITVHANK